MPLIPSQALSVLVSLIGADGQILVGRSVPFDEVAALNDGSEELTFTVARAGVFDHLRWWHSEDRQGRVPVPNLQGQHLGCFERISFRCTPSGEVVATRLGEAPKPMLRGDIASW